MLNLDSLEVLLKEIIFRWRFPYLLIKSQQYCIHSFYRKRTFQLQFMLENSRRNFIDNLVIPWLFKPVFYIWMTSVFNIGKYFVNFVEYNISIYIMISIILSVYLKEYISYLHSTLWSVSIWHVLIPYVLFNNMAYTFVLLQVDIEVSDKMRMSVDKPKQKQLCSP